MGAAKKLIDKKVLRDLVPINALSAAHIDEISRKTAIDELRSGAYAFKTGDRDYQTVYLLEGQIEFVDDSRNVVDSIVAGSEQARHPLAHKQPRQLSARARGKTVVARVDSSLLDVLLTWDESAGYDVVEIDSQDDGDWMTRMLQSQAFLQLPPSNIHQLLMRLEAVSVEAGEMIVRQGDDGDYFYIVKSGHLAVTRQASPRSKEVLLAELGEGACFGEEALVSGAKRNASVMMVTDGSLMRLSKNDFNELLREPLVHETDFAGARKLIDRGACWLDVRLPGEFENQAIRDSINLPLSALRERSAELDRDTDYIVCCDTGRRSAAGAFVLSQRGFKVYTLKNGLMDVPGDALAVRPDAAGSEPAGDAAIIPFDSESRPETAAADRRSHAAGGDSAADSVLIDKIAGAESDKLALQKEVERLEARVAELDHQVEQLAGNAEQERDRLKAELAQAHGELGASRQQQESGQQHRDRQVQELEQELGRLRDDYQQLGQRTSAVAGERDAANRDLQDARRQLAALQEKAGGREAESLLLQERLQQALAEHEQALAASRTEVESLQQRLDAAGRDYRQLEDRMAAAGELADTGQLQAARQQARADEFERRQAALENDLQGANQQIATLQDALQQAQAQLDKQLTQQQSETLAETEQLNRQIAELQQQLEQTGVDQATQRDSLAERVGQLQGELQQLQDGREELEQALAAANAQKDDLAGQLDSMKLALDEQQRLSQQQQSDREQLQQQLADVQRQLENKTAREQELQGELLELGRQGEVRSAQTQQQLEEAGARIAALETELNAARQQQQDAVRRHAELDARLAALAAESRSDLDGARNALSRAQTETENIKREHSRLMESLRKAERNLERERHDHEGEVYRLRRELKEAAGDSGASAGLAAELEALQTRLQDGTKVRDELEITLGERSAQLEDVQAEADRLVLQLQQAQESARQAEQQLLDSNHAANEEMTVHMAAEEKARQALREELAAAVAERNQARERLTVQGQELDELRLVAQAAQQQLASREDSEEKLLEELRHERDEALEQQRRQELERDEVLEQLRLTRQEIDQLRAEAEVTRGLVDMQAPSAAEAALREQLEQAQKNVDVAVRLRSQAEEKYTQLETEMERLRSQSRAAENGSVSAGHIPSLDKDDPHAAGELSPQFGTRGSQVVNDMPASAGNGAAATVLLTDNEPAASAGGFTSLLGGIVLGAAIAGAATWWVLSRPMPAIDAMGRSLAARVAGLVTEPTAPAAPTDEGAARTDKKTDGPTLHAKPDSSAAEPKSAPAPSDIASGSNHVSAVPPAGSTQQPSRIPDFIRDGSVTTGRETAEVRTAQHEAYEATAPAEAIPRQDPIDKPAPKKEQPLRLYSEVLNDGGRAPMLAEFQADSFEMGSGASSANFDERPRHRVKLHNFAISAREITFADYDRFARASGRALPNDNGWGRGDRPVINVSWQDAVAYTAWLTAQTGSRYRLPSEAEWEFAAHSGTDTRFWWGNEAGTGHANCFDCNSEWSGRMTAPTGSFAASAFRVHDMAGNVMEWVQDCYQPDYSTAPADGSAVSSGDCSRRVVRGGAYNSPSESLRSASRDAREADTRLDNLGFRIVKE
jgi:formylglycine-generating enzyme required for sulfatase activity/rhodanese-related sulfurtransferase/chromosome segregation ATPase